MVSNMRGRIINIVADLSEGGVINGSSYCAAKGAMIQLTKALSLEWANRGIRVNAIATGWLEGQASDPGLEKHIPLRRFIQAEDVVPGIAAVGRGVEV